MARPWPGLYAQVVNRTKCKLSSEREWREFEIERWWSALRQRGLQLKSLDPEHQRALFERFWPPLEERHRLLLTRSRSARRLRIIGRALLMAGLIAIGYGASYAGPSAGHWTQRAMAATLRGSCAMEYAEMPVSEADLAYESQCIARQRPLSR